MRLPHACAFIAMFVNSAAAVSAQYVCAARPEIVASCFDIRGRLSFWNGAPSARIWRIGTTRILGVHNDELPSKLAASVTGFDTEAWGTFTVCPLSRERVGQMQFVCVEAWKDLTFRQRSSKAAAPN